MSENTIVESTLTQRESNVTIREGLEVGSTDSFTLRNFREYEIVEQLPAQGGEADIYVISKAGKRFILKLYRFGIDPNLDALKKIKKITNENTKNFINILEIGKEDTRFFEIMEEATFGNLNKLIESKELNVANIYSLIESINASLEIFHKNNILHRDLEGVSSEMLARPLNKIKRRQRTEKLIKLGLFFKDIGLTLEEPYEFVGYLLSLSNESKTNAYYMKLSKETRKTNLRDVHFTLRELKVFIEYGLLFHITKLLESDLEILYGVIADFKGFYSEKDKFIEIGREYYIKNKLVSRI